ncbi:MAG: amidohydrolase family protein [Aristaeellaceae bacterium]
MTIDANVYWFPEEMFTDEALLARFLSDVPRAWGTAGRMMERGGRKQIVIERPVGCAGVDFLQGDYTLEHMLDMLDRAHVDRAVMKVPCVHEWMSLEMCRYFNDGMADFARRSGGRLSALAVLPPWGQPEQLAELERCRTELGMKGVQLCAHYGEMYLDDEAFAPLFERLNAYGMTAYVHHTPVPVEYRSIAAYNNLRRSLGRCEDQLTAVGRELFSGMFERYPRVRLVHSMLGGGFFTFKEMLMPHGPAGSDGRFAATPESMRKHLKDNLYFEMSHAQPWGTVLLETAVRILGADHIVYGSSCPVKEEWTVGGPAYVQGLAISEEEKQLILGGNAEMLYQL